MLSRWLFSSFRQEEVVIRILRVLFVAAVDDLSHLVSRIEINGSHGLAENIFRSGGRSGCPFWSEAPRIDARLLQRLQDLRAQDLILYTQYIRICLSRIVHVRIF